MPNGEPPCLWSELGCLGSEMGEKVDFHLLVEDKEDEEEASLPVLLPLLLPDFLPSGGKKRKDRLALIRQKCKITFLF